MIAAAVRATFHQLAQTAWLQRLATRYGMAKGRGFARRFVAGESIDEATRVATGLAGRGFLTTLDYLGEGASTSAAAAAAASAYRHIFETIVAAGVERNVSVKLTQLGLDVDRATIVDNMRRILETAEPLGFFIRVDMEDSRHTDATFRTLDTLWEQGHRGLGAVIQACLKRSPGDVERLNQMGLRIRLVKGAYLEPKTTAFQDKASVDAAFVELMQRLLDEGHYPAIATHDPTMIAATRAHAAARGHARDRFEFQMLYGIRRDLQASLVAEGYRVRVYVPFGQQWYPYFMRRLGERPANVGFVLRSLWGDRS